MNLDGFTKSPSSVFCCILRRCGVRLCTPRSSVFIRLELRAFCFAIFCIFMNIRRVNVRVLSVFVVIVFHIISGSCFASTGKTKEDDDAKLTAKELQASLMSYADLVTTVMGQVAYKLKKEELPRGSLLKNGKTLFRNFQVKSGSSLIIFFYSLVCSSLFQLSVISWQSLSTTLPLDGQNL